jgi:GNAT superfamily N-acetyltransferase
MDARITIQPAADADLPFLVARRRHVSEAAMRACVAEGRVIVARLDEAIVGWLRFGYFWDAVPFMHMLFVEPQHRGRGVGRALVSDWEQRMRQRGCEQAMTSTQADEAAQHFYRKLGYRDIGGFTLPGEPLEIVMHKAIL